LQVQEWVAANYHREVTVAKLAGVCSMSRRTFERRFKKATGKSPLRYLQDVRLEKAKDLLEKGDYTFETITNEVGYGDPSTFRRMFQKSTGLPPGLYRQRFGMNTVSSPLLDAAVGVQGGAG
jgi:transcriptional regulator GlxA family with amidase domain